MKYLLLAILHVMLFVGISSADDGPNLTDEKAKLSYSIGYQVGSDSNRQGMDINPKMLLKGVEDALSGSEPLMAENEMRSALMEVRKKLSAAQEEKKGDAAKLPGK
jgi:FKBP-type peptidyl-prolyl cis-trans isomerase FklB